MAKKEKGGKVCPVTEFPTTPEEGVLYCKKRGSNYSTEGFVQTSHSLGITNPCQRKVYRLREGKETYDYIVSHDGLLLKKAV